MAESDVEAGHRWTVPAAAAALGVIAGSVLMLIGFAGGVLPMVHRRATCLYSIKPPEEFAERYLEGIQAYGPEVSLMPFGAQCRYLAPSTGETAVSVIPLWPSVAIVLGLIVLLIGVIAANLPRAPRPAAR